MAEPEIQTGTTSADKSAKAQLASTLRNYGLDPSLVDTLWNDWYLGQGKGVDQILLDLPTTPQFQTRFPKFQEIQKAHPGFGVKNYMDFENAMKETKQRYGLPDGFYDTPDDIANFLIRGVSANEYEDRVKLGVAAAVQSPVENRAEMQRLYGVDLGHLTAYFIDPTKAEPELQKQVAAAAIGGQAVRSQFGLLSKDEAEKIAQLGLSEQEVGKGFADLARQQALMNVLPGQEGSQTGLTREQLMGAQFENNASAQEAVLQETNKRKAAFAAGGTFASGQKGVEGLGAGAA